MDSNPGLPNLTGVDLPQKHSGRWRALWTGLAFFDRSKVTPWLALRNTIGVVLPVALGFASNSPRAGLAIAVGALNVSYSDGSDPYAQRARRMLTSTIWCSIAVLLGGLTTAHNAEA